MCSCRVLSTQSNCYSCLLLLSYSHYVGLTATNSDETETTCTHISTDNFVFFISLKIYFWILVFFYVSFWRKFACLLFFTALTFFFILLCYNLASWKLSYWLKLFVICLILFWTAVIKTFPSFCINKAYLIVLSYVLSFSFTSDLLCHQMLAYRGLSDLPLSYCRIFTLWYKAPEDDCRWVYIVRFFRRHKSDQASIKVDPFL